MKTLLAHLKIKYWNGGKNVLALIFSASQGWEELNLF